MLALVTWAAALSFPADDPREVCKSASALGKQDAATRAETASFLPDGTALTPPPTCGALLFWHLPKTGGSTFEHVMFSQPETHCCYRGSCGTCTRTYADGRGCEARGLDASFAMPADLLSGAQSLEGRALFTSFHGGPLFVTPGATFDANGPSALLKDAAALRERTKTHSSGGGGGNGDRCRVVLATIVRHPVEQLLSAWQYTEGGPGNLAVAPFVAGYPPDLLLGVDSSTSAARQGEGATANATLRQATVDLAEQQLWSQFDVVGFTERFDATLLRIADAFGVAHLLETSLPDNPTSDAHPGQQPPTQAEVDEVARLRPELIAWYERRLEAFDAEVDADPAFKRRVEALRAAREAAAKRAAAEAGDGGDGDAGASSERSLAPEGEQGPTQASDEKTAMANDDMLQWMHSRHGASPSVGDS